MIVMTSSVGFGGGGGSRLAYLCERGYFCGFRARRCWVVSYLRVGLGCGLISIFVLILNRTHAKISVIFNESVPISVSFVCNCQSNKVTALCIRERERERGKNENK